ncbi:hypothetical protein GN956_G20910 [Arapaima gigas]
MVNEPDMRLRPGDEIIGVEEEVCPREVMTQSVDQQDVRLRELMMQALPSLSRDDTGPVSEGLSKVAMCAVAATALLGAR